MIKLKTEEAMRMIKMLKYKVQEHVLTFPREKESLSFDVLGERRDDRLVVSIFRRSINLNVCTFQGRNKSNNIILLKLDVNPTAKHINPRTGEVIIGSHIHIYNEETELREATPFDVENKDLYTICLTFFQKFNIIEPPKLNHQMTIFDIENV
ncbi:MAG: hypothetical protein FWG98_07940 [Candidatus Cloacimonetes bacterium]|nr:hypothetical protein [Candidatus Cloacimonadota bacterium]